MAAIFEQVANNRRMWECKQCHEMVAEDETVAYHLVDKILYGWCEPCFNERERAELAA